MPDSLPTVSLQQSACLPACSSCRTRSCAEKRASCGGSFVLDDVLSRRKIRAQSFTLLLHALSGPSQQRPAARFLDFSSYFIAVATHMTLSLASHTTTAFNSVFTEPLVLINASVDFFDPELSCCFCCTCCHRPPHALSHASGQSRPDSTQTSSSCNH